MTSGRRDIGQTAETAGLGFTQFLKEIIGRKIGVFLIKCTTNFDPVRNNFNRILFTGPAAEKHCYL
ncbi:MAG: hypothetical protein R2867_21695 [Caldilineaceae bacterium]